MAPDPTDLTVAEVAALLRQKPQTIRARCARGTMPGAYRVPGGREYRIRAEELERACAAVQPPAPGRRPLPADDPPVRPETLERLRARGLLT